MIESPNLQHYASLAILISGRGSNMVAIAEACQSGELNARVDLVISNQASAPGLEKAASMGIPTVTIPHKQFPTRNEFDLALSEELTSVKPDWVLLAGFMRILGNDFIDKWQDRLLNIHPSLLPKYPGLNTHQRAIDAGDTHAGASVHFVTRDLDAGPIVEQVKVSILPEDTAASLANRVIEKEHNLYISALKRCLMSN